MPASTIPILDFSAGVNPDQTKTVGFSSMYCLDPHTTPGVLRVNNKMTNDDDSAITDLVTCFDAYDGNASISAALFAYDDTGELFYRVSNVWTSVHTNASGGAGNFIKAFQTSLYYTWSTSGRLGKLTGDPTVGGNYTDSFKNLAAGGSSGDYYPMEVFAGSLYVGSGRYVGKLESDETTFTSAALTLAIGYEVQSMAVWNDRLCLGTVSGNKTVSEMIAFWDGVSDFPEQIIEVPKPGASALFNFDNTLYAFVGAQVYYFTGSEFKVAFQLPKFFDGLTNDKVKVRPGAVCLFNNQMLFGTACPSSQALSVFRSGIWSWGSHSEAFAKLLMFAFEGSVGSTPTSLVECGALKTFGSSNDKQILYSSFESSASSGIDLISYTLRNPSSSYLLTEAYTVGGVFGKLLKGVRFEFAKDMNTTQATNKVVVKYRADEDIDPNDDTTNFTTLGTIDNDTAGNNNQNDLLYGIYQRVKKIQFRFEFTASTSSTQGPEITGIYIY